MVFARQGSGTDESGLAALCLVRRMLYMRCAQECGIVGAIISVVDIVMAEADLYSFGVQQ